MSVLGVRRAVLVVVAASVVTAVLAGLARLGILLPGLHVFASRAADHGPLFVVGVFGTLISLEKCVALTRPVALVAPLLGAFTAATLATGFADVAHVAACVFALAFIAVNAALVRNEPRVTTVLPLFGSVALAIGIVRWALDHPVFESAPLWMAFFVLTIVGERVDLSSTTKKPAWAVPLVATLACIEAVVAILPADLAAETTRVEGALFVALALWLLAFDSRDLTARNVARYTAVAATCASTWLAVAGVLLLVNGLPAAGPLYDAPLHAIFLGFAMSMLFAHAPVVFPEVARVRLPFHRALYVSLAVLHVGLALRVAGDVVGHASARTAGTSTTAAALLVFAIAGVFARRRLRPSA